MPTAVAKRRTVPGILFASFSGIALFHNGVRFEFPRHTATGCATVGLRANPLVARRQGRVRRVSILRKALSVGEATSTSHERDSNSG